METITSISAEKEKIDFAAKAAYFFATNKFQNYYAGEGGIREGEPVAIRGGDSVLVFVSACDGLTIYDCAIREALPEGEYFYADKKPA